MWFPLQSSSLDLIPSPSASLSTTPFAFYHRVAGRTAATMREPEPVESAHSFQFATPDFPPNVDKLGVTGGSVRLPTSVTRCECKTGHECSTSKSALIY